MTTAGTRQVSGRHPPPQRDASPPRQSHAAALHGGRGTAVASTAQIVHARPFASVVGAAGPKKELRDAGAWGAPLLNKKLPSALGGPAKAKRRDHFRTQRLQCIV
jgi:hypothetical protein